MRTDWDVIVIGAGLAGLSAAASASRLGARVLVVEAHKPGGRARTVDRAGFTLNLGAHALYVNGPGVAVLHRLGVKPDGAPPPLRRYRALIGGGQHTLPTGPSSLLRTSALGARSKFQLGQLLMRLPRIEARTLASTSVTDWCRSLRLRSDAEAVLLGLFRLGTYLADFDQLSADAALLQLQAAASGGVLYLHGGWSQLVDALSKTLDIRTGVEAKGIRPVGHHLEVETNHGMLTAAGVVVATGAPAAIRRLLPADPGWVDLGPPPTAACLDLGVRRAPDPGYVLSLDDPLYATVQSPPARQAPVGQAVVAGIRYGARSAAEDRPQLEQLLREAGVATDDVVTQRFQAHLSVMGAMPRAATGGLAGRPGAEDTGVPGVTMAGDWVGPAGLLADAALVSGQVAGRAAVTHRPESTTMAS